MLKTRTPVVVLVATFNREQLLVERCIKSILNQEYLPNEIVIIDDSYEEHSLSTNTKSILKSLVPNQINLVILPNSRTKGLSGSLNTGIAYIANKYNIHSTYVAVLDDDDEWSKNHIKTCINTSSNADIVISNLIRVEKNNKYKNKIISSLKESDFYIKNPGVQGSSFFLKLSILLEAGMFDENLRSTTDRDLCIRLLELNPSITFTKKHTIIHYADDNRLRLSTKNSKNKLLGIEAFYKKYKSRMSNEEIENFINRSKEVFGYVPQKLNQSNFELKEIENKENVNLELVIGVISDSFLQIKPLIDSLNDLAATKSIEKLHLLILDNSIENNSFSELSKYSRNPKFTYSYISQFTQKKDAQNNIFGHAFHRGIGVKLSISQARTLLQKYLGNFVLNTPNAIVWILDDDMIIHDKVKIYINWLPKFKESGVDILLGTYEGSSPNPSINALRVQLVDLYNNLRWFDNVSYVKELTDRSLENKLLRAKYSDYYYDLSNKHYGHLESVYWQTNFDNFDNIDEVKDVMYRASYKILTGEPFFRPLVSDIATSPLNEAHSSTNRGGTTFIFNHEILHKTPNVSIQINQRDCRRSDMIWGLINKYYYNYNIKMVNFPIYHYRKSSDSVEFNISKAIDEIIGACIYGALKSSLPLFTQTNFNFSKSQKDIINKKFNKIFEDRISLYLQNFNRVKGLIKALRLIDTKGQLTTFLNNVSLWVNDENFNKIKRSKTLITPHELELFYSSLQIKVKEYTKVK